MDQLQLLDVLSRWIHVFLAIVLLGGSIFKRYVLIPAAKDLPAEEHDRLQERIAQKWRKLVGMSCGLLLFSGLYNYLVVAIPQHKGDPLYSALVGTKILLAFAVFFLASALTGRAKKFEAIRRNSAKWMSVTILLGILIVAISGYVKIVCKPTSGDDATPAEVTS